MLIDPTPLFQPRRRAKPRASAPVGPVAAGPVLIAAAYEYATAVTLTFDRAVSVIVSELQSIRVGDANAGEAYQGEDFEVLSPTQLRVNVYYLEPYAGSGITLWTADGQTGIVATDGGADWAGAADVVLPFETMKKRKTTRRKRAA